MDRRNLANLSAAIAAITVFGFTLGLMFPLLSLLMEERGISSDMIGYNAAMQPVGIVLAVFAIPGLVRRFRDAGAAWILNLSNDAWFGRTGYASLHFLHAVFRAVELRTWVVRAANTGVSGAIDPAGRVVAELPVFEEGTFVARVGPPGPPPFYARAGDAPVLAALAAIVLACVLRPAPPR